MWVGLVTTPLIIHTHIDPFSKHHHLRHLSLHQLRSIILTSDFYEPVAPPLIEVEEFSWTTGMAKAHTTAVRSWNAWNAHHDDGLESVDTLYPEAP